MKKQITSLRVERVRQFNTSMRCQKNYIMVFTLGNGSMVDEPRKNGWVVSKKHIEGGSRSRFFLNYNKAREYADTDNL